MMRAASLLSVLPFLLGMAQPPTLGSSVTVRLPPARPALPLPRVEGPGGRPLIVIDPGHGGHDPGASASDGLREKAVTLALAQAIRAALLDGGRVRVALTRADDHYLTLHERSGIARALRADLLVSVHTDSSNEPGARGATLYTLSDVASDPAGARLAERENRADIVNGVDLRRQPSGVAGALLELARRDSLAQAARFATLVRREAGSTVPFRVDFRRAAGFAVLRAPDVPSVLFEAGYLSNRDDEGRLTSSAGRAAIAEAVARAAAIYAAERSHR